MTSRPSKMPQDDASQADDTAGAMNDRLRKEVASWREGRVEDSSRQATDLSVAVTRSIVPPTNAKMRKAKPETAPVATPATAEKKPFGMSYGGTKREDYIKWMRARGVR